MSPHSGQNAEAFGQIGRHHVGRGAVKGDAGALQRTRDERDATLLTPVRHMETVAERPALLGAPKLLALT